MNYDDDICYAAQRGEREQQLRAEYEAAKLTGWEAEYEQWLDSLDEDIYE